MIVLLQSTHGQGIDFSQCIHPRISSRLSCLTVFNDKIDLNCLVPADLSPLDQLRFDCFGNGISQMIANLVTRVTLDRDTQVHSG